MLVRFADSVDGLDSAIAFMDEKTVCLLARLSVSVPMKIFGMDSSGISYNPPTSGRKLFRMKSTK